MHSRVPTGRIASGAVAAPGSGPRRFPRRGQRRSVAPGRGQQRQRHRATATARTFGRDRTVPTPTTAARGIAGHFAMTSSAAGVPQRSLRARANHQPPRRAPPAGCHGQDRESPARDPQGHLATGQGRFELDSCQWGGSPQTVGSARGRRLARRNIWQQEESSAAACQTPRAAPGGEGRPARGNMAEPARARRRSPVAGQSQGWPAGGCRGSGTSASNPCRWWRFQRIHITAQRKRGQRSHRAADFGAEW